MKSFCKPNPLPKYFGIDLDGTFHTKNKEAFQKNKDALRLLKERGITPFLCTGRDLMANKSYFDTEFFIETGYNGFPGVYMNGSLVYNAEGKIIKSEFIGRNFIEKFLNYAKHKRIGSKTIYLIGNIIYSTEKVSHSTLMIVPCLENVVAVETTHEKLLEEKVISIIAVEDPVDDFELIDEVSYVKYNDNKLFQICPPNCSKKMGVEILLNHYNLTGEDCAYIGDNANDREAMEYCKTSFAVGDADDETKQKARWVMDLKHDEGAFSKAVELLLE